MLCRAPLVRCGPLTNNPTLRSLKTIAGMTSRRRATPAAPRAAASNDVQGDMLEPSFANKGPVRAIALLVTIGVAARSTEFLPAAGLGFLHMLTMSSWLGTLIWTSFVFGIVAFKNLPRQAFGKLQAKLFPKYFTLSTVAPALLMATLHYSTGGAAPAKQLYLLGAAAISSFLNLFVVEPAATDVMLERYTMENMAAVERDEDRITALKQSFGKYHGISSLLNLVALVCGIGHAYYLGAHLVF